MTCVQHKLENCLQTNPDLSEFITWNIADKISNNRIRRMHQTHQKIKTCDCSQKIENTLTENKKCSQVLPDQSQLESDLTRLCVKTRYTGWTRINAVSMEHTTVYSLQSTVYRLQSTDYRLQTTVYSLQSIDYRLQSTVYSLQTSDQYFTTRIVASTEHYICTSPHCINSCPPLSIQWEVAKKGQNLGDDICEGSLHRKQCLLITMNSCNLNTNNNYQIKSSKY